MKTRYKVLVSRDLGGISVIKDGIETYQEAKEFASEEQAKAKFGYVVSFHEYIPQDEDVEYKNGSGDYRQIIVIRKDLDMPPGKLAAQVAHGSMKATLENLDDIRVQRWLDGAFTKIVVYVKTEQRLLAVYEKAKEAGLIAALITDNGRTVFNGVPTNTVVAIGPDLPENLKPVTGKLQLL